MVKKGKFLNKPETGLFEQIVSIRGKERKYYVYIPDGYRESAAEIFILPANGKTAVDCLQNSGWKELADREKIMDYP